MLNKLYHYSGDGIPAYEPRSQMNSYAEKPVGLWVSVGNEWESFCRSEDFKTDDIRVRQKVTLAPTCRTLLLSDADDLDGFTKAYGLPPEYD
jgi:hypothetical protein